MKKEKYLESSAVISDCGKYRYVLKRVWNASLPVCVFVGLNPSTADANEDDPTIRRCVGFAKSWGYGGLVMLNLFAYRATNPQDMLCSVLIDPVGPENDNHILKEVSKAGIVIAAWGFHGANFGRDKRIIVMVKNLHYLKLTKDGQPSHPLYLRKDLKPLLWVPMK